MKICTTSCHRDDQVLVVSTVRNLEPGVVMGTTVDSETTHVVLNKPRRTINLLKAIIYGSYVVNLNWVRHMIIMYLWWLSNSHVIIYYLYIR